MPSRRSVSLADERAVRRRGRRARSAPRRGGCQTSSAWLEAVDVLGDPELGDAALVGRRTVALEVVRREVLVGAGVEVVWAQMEVVVGEHSGRAIQAGSRALGRAASSSSATRRSSGVVTLRFSAGLGDDDHPPSARSISEASSVAVASSSVGDVERPLERRAAEDLRASAPTTARSARASRATTLRRVGALDRVGDGRRGDRRVGAGVHRQRGDHRSASSGVSSGRAASWTSTSSPAPAAASARRTESEREPAATVDSGSRRRRRGHPARRQRRPRSARSPDGAAAQRVDAPLEHRAPGQLHERLGAVGPEALAAPAATISATAISETVAHAPYKPSPALERAREPVTRPRLRPSGSWPSRRAARRGSSRPLPRPCRARTSARTRGSSSSA